MRDIEVLTLDLELDKGVSRQIADVVKRDETWLEAFGPNRHPLFGVELVVFSVRCLATGATAWRDYHRIGDAGTGHQYSSRDVVSVYLRQDFLHQSNFVVNVDGHLELNLLGANGMKM